MKARLPQGYGGGGAANIQQLARQAQKIQEEMDAASAELDQDVYKRQSLRKTYDVFLHLRRTPQFTESLPVSCGGSFCDRKR